MDTKYDNKRLRQVPDYTNAQDVFNTWDLDITSYDAIDAMLEKPDNFSKIMQGLKKSINQKTPTSDLAWLKSFLNCIPQSLRNKKNNEMIAELEFQIKKLFNPAKIIPLDNNKASLASNLEENISLWLGRKNQAIAEYGFFAKEQNMPESAVYSQSFKLTVIITMLTLYFIMQKSMPAILGSSRFGKN